MLIKLNTFKGKLNSELLRIQVKSECTKYLTLLQSQKVIEGFFLICDLTNNTENSNKLVVNLKIGIAGFIEQIDVSIEI